MVAGAARLMAAEGGPAAQQADRRSVSRNGKDQQVWSSRIPGIVMPQTIPGKVLVE